MIDAAVASLGTPGDKTLAVARFSMRLAFPVVFGPSIRDVEQAARMLLNRSRPLIPLMEA